jgi:hypothetical protein
MGLFDEAEMSDSTPALDLRALGMFPLCASQERSLLARSVAQESSAVPPPSLIRFGFKLSGQVKLEAVGTSLGRFVERHPALRSSFAENILLPREERYRRIAAFKRTALFEPGVFVQQVHERVVPSITKFDWTAMPRQEHEEALLRVIRSEDLRPFNDSDRCRLRALFIRIASQEALLLLTFDHVIFDGHSGSITSKELQHLLSGRSDVATELSLGIPRCGFPAFAEWQNRAFRTSYFRSSISFWRDQWARFAPYRISYDDLPFSRSAVQESDYVFSTEHSTLEESESAALKAFAGEAKTSLFTVCLAALARVLSEYTGRSSVVVWSHLLNRVQPGTLNSVGFFNNTHILGFELPPSVTGRELVDQAGRVIAAALAHQELPLQFLWHTLRCVPMFYDSRVLMDFRVLAPRSPMTESSPVLVERLTLPEPVTPRLSSLGIYVTDRGDTIQISATFSRAKFSQSGVNDLLRDLRATILDLVTDPGAAFHRRSTVDRPRQSGMGDFLLLDSMCIPFV